MSLTTLNYGILVGWMAPVLPLLQSSTDPVIGDTPLTDDMVALAGALAYGGALIGCFLWAGVANRLGRKKSTVLIILPYVISYSLLCFTNSRATLYMARLIGGLGNAGGLINAPMYVAEMSTTRLKDRLVPFLLLSSCLGTLYAFAFGWLLPFHVFNYVNLAITVLSLMCSFYLPESPVYHLKCNDLGKAKKSLIWLRCYQEDNEQHGKQLEIDLNVLESSFLNKDSLTPWRDLLIPSTRNALLIGIGLVLTQQFSGMSIICVYALSLFQSAHLSSSLISPQFSLVIVALVHLPGAFGSLYLVPKYNRKFILITTNFSVALCLLIVGAFYYLKSIKFQYLSYISLIPVIFLSVHIMIYLISNPAYFMVMSEIFAAETRNACMGIVVICQHILMFSLVRLYPFMNGNLGIFGCLWMFSGAVFIAIILIYFLVPETRNKSFKAVVTKLSPGNTRYNPPKVIEENELKILS